MEAKLKAITEQVVSLEKKKNNLAKEIEKYKLKNGLYHPMSELINYKGKTISSITLVEKQRNGRLVTDFMYNDELIFNVTDNGHLHYSSYRGGVMDYCEDDGKYYHYVFGRSTPHEYVGFLEIEFQDEF